MKKEFLDRRKSIGRGRLSGDDWLKKQATLPVSQAIGRIYRHENDWGVVILLDKRFAENYARNLQSYLPAWIGKIETYERAEHLSHYNLTKGKTTVHRERMLTRLLKNCDYFTVTWLTIEGKTAFAQFKITTNEREEGTLL
jgi:hypothetical protein